MHDINGYHETSFWKHIFARRVTIVHLEQVPNLLKATSLVKLLNISQFLAQKVVLGVSKAWQSSNNVHHALLDFIVQHKESNQRTRLATHFESDFVCQSGLLILEKEWTKQLRPIINVKKELFVQMALQETTPVQACFEIRQLVT